MPPMLTVLILMIIIGTGGWIRYIQKEEEPTIPVSAENTNLEKKEYEGNQVVRSILLSYEAGIVSNRKEEGNYSIFMQNLINYLEQAQIEWKENSEQQLKKELTDLEHIIQKEQENDFSRMSIDGRAVAIDIAGRIYSMVGLELVTDLDGNIKQILTPS